MLYAIDVARERTWRFAVATCARYSELDRAKRDPGRDAEMPGLRGRLCRPFHRLRHLAFGRRSDTLDNFGSVLCVFDIYDNKGPSDRGRRKIPPAASRTALVLVRHRKGRIWPPASPGCRIFRYLGTKTQNLRKSCRKSVIFAVLAVTI
jgi:hypothetical protein